MCISKRTEEIIYSSVSIVARTEEWWRESNMFWKKCDSPYKRVFYICLYTQVSNSGPLGPLVYDGKTSTVSFHDNSFALFFCFQFLINSILVIFSLFQ